MFSHQHIDREWRISDINNFKPTYLKKILGNLKHFFRLYPEFKRLVFWMYMGKQFWLFSNIFSHFTSNIIDVKTLVVESYLEFCFVWIIVMKGLRFLSFFSKGEFISEGNFGVSKSPKNQTKLF